MNEPKIDQDEAEKCSEQAQLVNKNMDMTQPVGPAGIHFWIIYARCVLTNIEKKNVVADQGELAFGDGKVLIESKSDYVKLTDEPESNENSLCQTGNNLAHFSEFKPNQTEKGLFLIYCFFSI